MASANGDGIASQESSSLLPTPVQAEKYKNFKKLHDEAFRLVETGIELEQEGRKPEAITSYESGLASIEKAVEIYMESDSNPLWDVYFEQIVKMKNSRKDVVNRLAQLRQVPLHPVDLLLPADPPSYEEATSPTSPYASVSNALNQIRLDKMIADSDILYKQENVRVYFIAPDGNVSSLSDPLPLIIAQIQAENAEGPTFYIHIGSWVYPLVPCISPMLNADSRTFIIPDLQSSVAGSAVGLVLPEDADGSLYEILQDILQGILQPTSTAAASVPPLRPLPPTAAPIDERMSRRISQGIVTGAHYLSLGLVKGAECAGSLMNKGTPKLIEHIQPATDPQPVPPNVKKGLKVAKNVTGTAVTVTTFIAGKVGAATMSLGRFLAPHVQAQGTKLLTSVSGISHDDASSKMEGALEVTAGAVQGFTTVYGALENAATILAKNMAENTVQVVQHRFGPQAGEATGDTLAAVGNAVVVGHTARSFTVKGIAKRTAKDAGKALVEDYKVQVPEEGKEAMEEDESEEEKKKLNHDMPGPSKKL